MTRRRFASVLALPALAQPAPPSGLHLFLLAGQSNMAGRGVVEPQDQLPIPGVFTLDKALEWQPAVDPIHFDKPIAGVCLGRSFARTLQRLAPGAPFGLIPAALGGSSLDEWKPGGALFSNAVRRAAAASKSGALRGILWHQGEAESAAESRARTYARRWTSMISALRSELGAPALPVVVGQLGLFLQLADGKSPFAPLVNEQLATLPLQVPATAFVSSAGLAHKGDEVHFDAPSLRELGRRYAHAYLTLDPRWGA
jgi:hypothetical protein